MDTVITDFQTARTTYVALKSKAQKAMQTEFTALLTQAATLFTDFKTEFGETLALPAIVTKFAVNSEVKTRKPRTPKASTPAVETAATTTTETAEPVATISGKKLAGLKKSYNSLTTKIAAAKADGKECKDLEDKLYEVTDALQLAGVNVANLAADPANVPPVPAPVPVTTSTFSPF